MNDNHPKQSAAIRKSILRNPEVPIRSDGRVGHEPSERQRVSFPQTTMERYQKGSQLFHSPRPNMMNQLCDNMKQVIMEEPKMIESLADLSKDSKYLANREVTPIISWVYKWLTVIFQISSKLNHPSNQAIYKNLTKLETDERSEAAANKATQLISKTARKLTENSSLQKSQDIREEITSLIDDLVELEYGEADKTLKDVKPIPLPFEEDYLGFTKFSSPNILLPNKRIETQRFFDRINEDVERELRLMSSNPEPQSWIVAKAKPSENRCKCLKEFYDKHSSCCWTVRQF